ncbi:MAG: hypothetical protein KJ000_18075 [Pirellulaceae bacterium]|nr:hypothetical protein [Pirellulaceae bacterium]
MTAEELDILRFFRRFQVGPAEMLFFTPNDCKVAAKHFLAAMRSLIDKDLVVKERPIQAYSLTSAGYRLSLRAPKKMPAPRLKK